MGSDGSINNGGGSGCITNGGGSFIGGGSGDIEGWDGITKLGRNGGGSSC